MRSIWLVWDPSVLVFPRDWPLGSSLIELSGMLRNVSLVKYHNLNSAVREECEPPPYYFGYTTAASR
jgi:hypothetical protein